MSKSYWRYIIAIVGLGLLSAAQPVIDSGASQASAEQDNNGAAQNAGIASVLSRIGGALEAQANKPDAHEEERNQREIRDIVAQEGMEKWAQAMFWATTAALVISVFGLLLIFVTFRETRVGARAALMAQRPWLDAAISIHGIARDSEGYVLRIELTITNVGNTPATEVRYDLRGAIYMPSFEQGWNRAIVERDRQLRQNVVESQARLAGQPIGGCAVFPRDTLAIFDEASLTGKPSEMVPIAFVTVGLLYGFAGGVGETVKTFIVKSFGLPNETGFDTISDYGWAFTDTDAVVEQWKTVGRAT